MGLLSGKKRIACFLIELMFGVKINKHIIFKRYSGEPEEQHTPQEEYEVTNIEFTERLEKEDVEIFQYQGEPVIVPVKKYYPPDTGAAMAWLKNRKTDRWKDKHETEFSGPGGGPIQVYALSDAELDQKLIELEAAGTE